MRKFIATLCAALFIIGALSFDAGADLLLRSQAEKITSADNTNIPPASMVVDAAHNVWTVSPSGTHVCYMNGIQVGGCNFAITLLFYHSRIFVFNNVGVWYEWMPATGNFVGLPGDPRTSVSASGATIPSATQILDSSLNLWTVNASGQCLENNVQANACANVSILLYYIGRVYKFDTFGLWYQWDGASWASITGDPRSSGMASANNTSLYAENASVNDASGNTWTVWYGTCRKNGTPSSGCINVVWMLYYNNLVYFVDNVGQWHQWNGAAWVNVASDPRTLTTYYVSNSGADTNNGAIGTPFATLAKANSVATPGTTVFVRAGTYTGNFYFTASGTAANPITFQNYPGEKPTISLAGGTVGLSGSYIILSGFYIHDAATGNAVYNTGGAGMFSQTGSYQLIVNNEVAYVSQAGIQIYRNSYITVLWNYVHDVCLNNYQLAAPVFASSIQLFGPNTTAVVYSSAVTEGNKILHNKTMNNWGENIYAFGGHDNVEIAYNISMNSVHVGNGLVSTENSSMHDNLIWWTSSGWNTTYCLEVGTDDGSNVMIASNNNYIYNNICYGGGIGIGEAAGGNMGITNEYFYNNSVLGGLLGRAIEVLYWNQAAQWNNIVFRNNILYGSIDQWPANTPTVTSGIIADHNFWTAEPAGALAIFANPATDVVGNALSAVAQAPGSVSDSTLTQAWFTPTSSSPLLGKGVTIPGYTIDALGQTRLNPPAIGAIQ
jgi:hypothetical protein